MGECCVESQEILPQARSEYRASSTEIVEQSDVEGTTEDSVIIESTVGTLGFLEAPSSYATGFAARLPPESYSDATSGDDLAKFLSRPVQIFNYTWQQSDIVGSSIAFNPWQLLFASPPIARKLQNYAWLKCDLKIKFMLNASPFYYGATMMTYHPLPNFHPGGIVNDAATRYFIPYSQRPHLWIYPQNNEGGEMTLPFFYEKNWITTARNQDFIDMGRVTSFVVAPLASANGATGTGVTVQVYAWAENVVVSGPTTGLIQQSDDYGSSSVSGMASAVAESMSALRRIPVIAPYATATQTGARTIASIASRIGFSNPPVLDDHRPVRTGAFPPLATTEISYPYERLTVDPKNELSVDPGILGLPSEDELSIWSLVTKESYLCTIPWTSGDATDALLFNTAVSPVMYDYESSAARLYQTPMAWVSQLFQFWRGDIIFRFRVIATQFHRGRLRFVYDPAGDTATNILNTVATQATCFNEVVDITKDTNVEIRVPYNQALSWCRTFVPTSASQIPFTVGNSTIWNNVSGVTNGVLALRVLTGLTAPTATSNVQIIVSVRGADNLEFASPSAIHQRYSFFQQQSDSYEETPSTQVVVGGSPSQEAPGRYLVNHGEHVVSLRQLLRRMNLSQVVTFAPLATDNTLQVSTIRMAHLPPFYGYDPNGLQNAKGTLVPANTYKFNFVPVTPLSWIAPAFMGMRGSMNCVVSFSGREYVRNAAVARPHFSTTAHYTSSSVVATDFSIAARFMSASSIPTSGGSAATDQATLATLQFQKPMYSAYKMWVTNPETGTASSSRDDSFSGLTQISFDHMTQPAGLIQPTVVRLHQGIGTDFNLHFFLNVPVVYSYLTTPIAG